MKRFKNVFTIAALTLLLTLGYCSQTLAHFVWVYAEDGKVLVVFGEGLDPDQAKFLSGLEEMSSFTSNGDGYEAIELEKKVDGEDGWFELPQEGLGQSVEVSCPYGIFGRGEKLMRLDYSAKYTRCSGLQLDSENTSGNLKLDIVPSFENGQLKLNAYFNGKLTEDVEIKLESVDCESTEEVTGEGGVALLAPNVRYVVRAKYSTDESGEIDGKQYSESRYYCTLVLDVDGSMIETVKVTNDEEKSTTKVQKVETDYAELPRGMTSFGATYLDHSIYVIGGKSGRAHSYAKSYQNREVFRLDLEGDGEWEVAGENLGLQGLAIVGHDSKIYRIGGLEARNKEGEEHDLHSISEFVSFDPASKSWETLPALPVARSSFDACIMNDRVYVVGGWTMNGEAKAKWATDILSFDLTDPNSKWEKIAAPFETRAMAVRPCNGKLIVVGGIENAGGTTNTVHIFDSTSSEWSVGPEVPADGGMKSFGCSAVTLGNQLYVSTYDGGIYELSSDMLSWNKVHQLESGRFFHQMLPVGESRFALVGGSHMQNGSQVEIEVYEVVKDSPSPSKAGG